MVEKKEVKKDEVVGSVDQFAFILLNDEIKDLKNRVANIEVNINKIVEFLSEAKTQEAATPKNEDKPHVVKAITPEKTRWGFRG